MGLPTVQKAFSRALHQHDDVIKWKHFPRFWPFVRGIHRSTVTSPHKGQWRGALMFSLICVRIKGWVNNREVGDLRRYRVHCDVIVMGHAYPSCQSLGMEEAGQDLVSMVYRHYVLKCNAANGVNLLIWKIKPIYHAQGFVMPLFCHGYVMNSCGLLLYICPYIYRLPTVLGQGINPKKYR